MSDHWRPRFHVHPSYGFLNDPNGPILTDGGWQLYFQFRPHPSGDAPVEWGHVSSPDGVHWSRHPAAITPTAGAPDADGCWSGNTVRDDAGRVVAFYSGLRPGHPYQSVLRAVSTDGGRSFGTPEQVVDDPAPEERIREFRDPFVWRDGDRWRMVVGACTVDEVAMIRSYESVDLQRWTATGRLLESPRTRIDGIDTGWMWECPQVIGHGTDTATVVSTMISSPDGSTAIGESGFGEVIALRTPVPPAAEPDPRPALVDHGTNLYAASVMRDSPDGTLLWGWITESRPRASCVADGWSGVISLPRVIEVDAGHLRQRPLPALSSLRQERLEPAATDRGVRYDGVPGQAELRVALGPDVDTAGWSLGFDSEQRFELTVDRGRGELVLDRSRAGVDARLGPVRTVVSDPALTAGGPYEVVAFLDGSVLEVFTSSGLVATTRWYPAAAPPWTLEVTGGEAAAWALGPGTQPW